jgi:hypothetical protein
MLKAERKIRLVLHLQQRQAAVEQGMHSRSSELLTSPVDTAIDVYEVINTITSCGCWAST